MFLCEDFLLYLSTRSNFSSYRSQVKRLLRRPFEASEKETSKIKHAYDSFEKQGVCEIRSELNNKKIKFISILNDSYPEKLKNISDPPLGIYVKGNIKQLHKTKMVSIVGTRIPTRYGIKVTNEISNYLTECGATVISGMAAGIDSIAHKSAIKNTVAVLGTGVDIVFPSFNRSLYEEIIFNNSLVLSEYKPDEHANPWNFPQRNRIISALSDVVIVVEGTIQSGALITARFAIKQNKKLYAVPGQLNSNVSSGPNALIKSGVAELFTSTSELIENVYGEKGSEMKASSEIKLTDNQKTIYKVFDVEELSFDELVSLTKMDFKCLVKELSMLEIKGIIEKNRNGNYIKI